MILTCSQLACTSMRSAHANSSHQKMSKQPQYNERHERSNSAVGERSRRGEFHGISVGPEKRLSAESLSSQGAALCWRASARALGCQKLRRKSLEGSSAGSGGFRFPRLLGAVLVPSISWRVRLRSSAFGNCHEHKASCSIPPHLPSMLICRISPATP